MLLSINFHQFKGPYVCSHIAASGEMSYKI